MNDDRRLRIASIFGVVIQVEPRAHDRNHYEDNRARHRKRRQTDSRSGINQQGQPSCGEQPVRHQEHGGRPFSAAEPDDGHREASDRGDA
jgi:hypothetical protein